jgi:CheY-like chemotaxis protein/HAMP domain-containing protein
MTTSDPHRPASSRSTLLRRQCLLGAVAALAVIASVVGLALHFQAGVTQAVENIARREAPRLVAEGQVALGATRCRREDQQLELSLASASARLAAFRAWAVAAEELRSALDAYSQALPETERAEVAGWKSDAALYNQEISTLVDRFESNQAPSISVFREKLAPYRARIDRIASLAEAKSQVVGRRINDSEREIQELIASGRALTGTALLASALLLMAAVTWVLLAVLRRVNVLSDAVGRLVAGEFDTRVACDSRDEIGVLACLINELATNLANHASPSADHPLPQAQTPPSGARGAGPCRVLVVEDGPENRRFMNLVLRRAGVEVTLAENGREAVDLAMACTANGEPEFDLVLMDMEMPVMNGHDATRQLRQQGYSGQIIAITGHTRSYDREKCLDAGCDQYVCKPVDRDTLLSLVGVVENRSPAGTDEPARHS